MSTPERNTRRIRSSSLLVAALAATACAGARAETPTARPHGNAGIEVVVENHAWTDMSVYAAAAGGKIRLGSVTSGRTMSFRVPSLVDHVVDMELFADPLASSDVYRTGRLMVLEGQRVTWTIHESAMGGSIVVR